MPTGSIRFPDTEDHAIYRNTNLPPLHSWTIMAWAKLSIDRNAISTFWKFGGTNHQAYMCQVNADGRQLVSWNDVTAGAGIELAIGQWYHLAQTVTGPGTGQFLTYLNGELAFINHGNGALVQGQLALGDMSTTGQQPLNGCMAAVKIWDRPLTQREIQREMRQYAPAQYPLLNTFAPLRSRDELTLNYAGMLGAWTIVGTSHVAEEGPPIPWMARPVFPLRFFDFGRSVGTTSLMVAPARLQWQAAGLPQSRTLLAQPARGMWRAQDTSGTRLLTLAPSRVQWSSQSLSLTHTLLSTPAQVAWQGSVGSVGTGTPESGGAITRLLPYRHRRTEQRQSTPPILTTGITLHGTVSIGSAPESTPTSLTIMHDVPGYTPYRDHVLLVMCVGLDANTPRPTNATCNGLSIPMIASLTGDSVSQELAVFVLQDPPMGLVNLTATFTAGGCAGAVAYCLAGVEPQYPYVVPVVAGAGSVASISSQIDSLVDGFVCDFVVVNSDPVLTAGRKQRTVANFNVPDTGAGGGTMIGASVGDAGGRAVLSWEFSASASRTSRVLLAFNPALRRTRYAFAQGAAGEAVVSVAPVRIQWQAHQPRMPQFVTVTPARVQWQVEVLRQARIHAFMRGRLTATPRLRYPVRQGVAGNHLLNQGLVAWYLPQPWMFPGDRLYDMLGRADGAWSNHDAGGTALSGWGAHGRYGSRGELHFDGVNDAISLDPISMGGAVFTVALWVHPTIPRGVEEYGGILVDNNNLGIYYTFSTISFYENGGHSALTVLPVNAWTHVAIVSTGNQMAFYYNGVLQRTLNYTPPTPTWKWIGNDEFNVAFQGYLDDIRLYTRALPSEQVEALYGLTVQGNAGLLQAPRRLWMISGSGMPQGTSEIVVPVTPARMLWRASAAMLSAPRLITAVRWQWRAQRVGLGEPKQVVPAQVSWRAGTLVVRHNILAQPAYLAWRQQITLPGNRSNLFGRRGIASSIRYPLAYPEPGAGGMRQPDIQQMTWNTTNPLAQTSMRILPAQMQWVARQIGGTRVFVEPARWQWRAQVRGGAGYAIVPARQQWAASAPPIHRLAAIGIARQLWRTTPSLLTRGILLTSSRMQWQAQSPHIPRVILAARMQWRGHAVVVRGLIIVQPAHLQWQARASLRVPSYYPFRQYVWRRWRY